MFHRFNGSSLGTELRENCENPRERNKSHARTLIGLRKNEWRKTRTRYGRAQMSRVYATTCGRERVKYPKLFYPKRILAENIFDENNGCPNRILVEKLRLLYTYAKLTLDENFSGAVKIA